MRFVDFFKLVEAETGVPTPSLSIPRPIERLSARALWLAHRVFFGKENKSYDAVYVEMGQAFWYLDASRARDVLGFRPRAPSETVRDTASWLQANMDRFD